MSGKSPLNLLEQKRIRFVMACIMSTYNLANMQLVAKVFGNSEVMTLSKEEYFRVLKLVADNEEFTSDLRDFGFEPTGGRPIQFDQSVVNKVLDAVESVAKDVMENRIPTLSPDDDLWGYKWEVWECFKRYSPSQCDFAEMMFSLSSKRFWLDKQATN
jgi:predicted nucleic-acid-binding protein